METTPLNPPRKKRGPTPRLGPVVQTGVYLPYELLEWAKEQKEGLSGLVRRLLSEERERQMKKLDDQQTKALDKP